jgi:Protein of unknown function (DUF2946)
MQRLSRPAPNHFGLKVVAIALAIVFVVFGAQAASHSHANPQDEAACQVCQVAHSSFAPTPVTLWLFTPFLASGYIQPFVLVFHQELFFHDSPSRAPPIV